MKPNYGLFLSIMSSFIFDGDMFVVQFVYVLPTLSKHIKRDRCSFEDTK